MKARHVAWLAIVLAMLLAACGQAAPAAPTQAPVGAAPKTEGTAKVEYPTMAFKAGTPLQEQHNIGLALAEFARNMSETSGGKATVEIFYNGMLVTGKTELEGISKGVVDFGSIVSAYHAGELPFFDEAALMPLLYNYKSLPVLFPKVKSHLEQELAVHRIRLLAHYPTTVGFFFPKPIDPKNPDFTGLKMRSVGGGMTSMIRQFGGSTVDMPSPEVPVALRTGIIQALGTSYMTWSAIGIMEDVPYAYYSDDFASFTLLLGMSADRYAQLPPVVKQLIDRAALASERWIYENAKRQDLEVMEKAQRNPKIKLHELTPDEVKVWREKMQPVYDDFAKRYADKGAQLVKFAKDALAETSK